MVFPIWVSPGNWSVTQERLKAREIFWFAPGLTGVLHVFALLGRYDDTPVGDTGKSERPGIFGLALACKWFRPIGQAHVFSGTTA